MCAPKVGHVEGDVVADGTNYKPRLFGPWLLVYGGSTLDTTLDVRAIETNAGLKVGWRTAAVHSGSPDSHETLLTERTSNGSHPEAVSLATKTSQLLLQAVVWAGLTAGTAPKTAFARLWYTIRDAGWVVSRARIPLIPSSGKVIATIGMPWKCAGVTGVMAAIQYTGVQGTIEDPTLMMRTFETGDARMPGAWSALTTMTDVTADAGVNSGTQAVTTTGKMMAQGGLRWFTSGTDPNAYADVVLAAKM